MCPKNNDVEDDTYINNESKDKSTMLKSLTQEHHRTIVKNLEYIDDKLVDTGANKFRRRFKEQSKEKFIEY